MFTVDDDPVVRTILVRAAEAVALPAEAFATGAEALAAIDAARAGCLILDLRLPDMDGFGLLAALRARGAAMPAVVLTGFADVPTAVRALRAGVFDFFEKPISGHVVMERVQAAIALDAEQRQRATRLHEFASRVDRLTPREREVMALVVDGRSSRAIAEALSLSPKTVETHRARVMAKTGAGSLAELIRFGLLVGRDRDDLSLAVDPAAAYASPPQGGTRR